MPEIETKRVRLRMFSKNDLDDLARLFGNAQVMKYIGSECRAATREEVAVALNSMILHWKRNGFGRFALVLKDSNEFIGCAGLRSFEGVAEIVYMLDEPFWGKGLATEVAEACLKYGFETHNFDSIIAMTRHSNIPSRTIMDKIGMRFEKEDTAFGISVVRYAISRQEYESRHLNVENSD